MKLKNTIVLFLFFCSLLKAFGQSSGQNYTISPYSNFGLGEILNLNLAEAGNNGQTHSGAYSYSFFNPATLGNLKFTTFDFGLNYRYGVVETNGSQRSFQGGGLSYLSLAFRSLHKNIPRYSDSLGTKKRTGSLPLNWNTYISLFPTTTVGYNYTVENTQPFLTRTAHAGKGGVNSAEMGNSLSVGKHFSVGYSAAFLFGQLSDRSVFSAPDSSDLFIIDDEKVVNVRGFKHQMGLQYQFKLDSTYHRFAVSRRIYSGAKASNARLTQVFGYVNGSLTSADTVLNQVGTYSGISMPGGWGFGYNFQWRKKWSIGLDYYTEKWSNYSAFFQPNQKLTNRTDYGFTFMLNPIDEKQGKAKKMGVPLRLGARYSETQNVFTTTNNVRTTIAENNIFIGFGIPFTRRYFDNQVLRSMINVRVDYTSRGQAKNGLAKEQYLVTTVSFNLGDIWFQRRKFD
jgi:hypothetical protein